jgi:hypothetical protein
MQPVKEKNQASAAFLGVSGLSGNVVDGCCNHTTILTGPTKAGGCTSQTALA